MTSKVTEFENISPEVLTEFVSFYRDKKGKKLKFSKYDESSMQYKQAEGSAFLFNLLNENRLALLADEVGMGKTIQALAVCATLWQQKPDARILILAPRNEVAYNWAQEYETFIKVHYKLRDDIVKSKVDGEPINPAVFCGNLYDLASEVQKKWGKLFIGKISSFSSLYNSKHCNVNSRLKRIGIQTKTNFKRSKLDTIEAVQEIAGLLRQDIIKNLPDNYFDLVIIDEAHYFRNVNGKSLRVAVAKKFFGSGTDKMAKRTLLLTATPNHSSSDNIKAIVSYFDNDKYKDSTYKDILNEICLRRFRRLSGKIKYNYRKEAKAEANFDEQPMSELFFGIYQKQLVIEYLKNKKNGETGSRRNMLRFLEGVEMIPKEQTSSKQQSDAEQKSGGGDYSKGADGRLLLKLSKKYQDIFGDTPPHPKYEKLNKQLIGDTENLNIPNPKKLVFVRRIPSVHEIAARSIFRYDQILLSKINNALDSNINLAPGQGDFRKYYESKCNLTDSEDSIINQEAKDDYTGEESENLKKIPTSKVMSLFKSLEKKDSTHASRFRLRFNGSKPSVFNIFFAPGADYYQEEYDVKIKKSYLTEKTYNDDYFVSCLLHRTKSLDGAIRSKINSTLGKAVYTKKPEQRLQLSTLMTIFWRYLEGSKFTEETKEKVRKEYLNLSIYQKEALSAFLKNGILLASSALIDLYVAFIKASKNSNSTAVNLYKDFTIKVKNLLPNTPIPLLIIESILNFQVLCEKVFNLTSADDLLNEKWEIFRNAQPAYAYSGDTKNKRVMSSFNTPFYPDILISTSVLQEGVNLQYFCDQVIHYGIAWTPGDNEQRVGRIDRMFSKTERNLDQDREGQQGSTLDITYPYLKNTIDQDHLAKFICTKFKEENLIDKCEASNDVVGFDPSKPIDGNWAKYFRTPNQENVKDPYGVTKNRLPKQNPTFKLKKHQSTACDIDKQIIKSFKLCNDPIYSSKLSDDTICVLDPKIKKSDGSSRSQPVVVKLNYDAQLTGVLNETTYTLSLITPIGTKSQIRVFEKKYDLFKKKYEKEYIAVKLCLDNRQVTTSIFGIYAKVDLPVFLNHKDAPLSSVELIKNYKDLILCADFMEQGVLGKDLGIEDVVERKKKTIPAISTSSSLRNSYNSIKSKSEWKTKGDFIYLDRRYRGKKIPIRKIWELNHIDKYVKYLPNRRIIPYYSKDVQEIELEALKHIERIRNKDKFW